MITALGRLPAEVEAIEFFDVIDLLDYWADWPPTHEILKLVHEVRRAPKVRPIAHPSAGDDPSGIGSLVARFPNGFVPADR